MDQPVVKPSKKPRKRWWIPILVLSLAGAAAAALIATKPKPQPVKITERAWLVATQEVTAARYQPSLVLYGRLESLWSSQLTAGVAADVTQVSVIDGDSAAKGQLLVTLDDRDARLQLAQREAELKQAEARIAAERRLHKANQDALPREQRLARLTRDEETRLQGLVRKKVGTQSQLDSARQTAEKQAISLSARQQAVDDHDARLAEVEAARARAEALRDQALLELERCRVVAPFNARIARVLVSPGKRVRVGDPLLEAYDTDAMIVRAQIPNRYLAAVRAARTAGTVLQAEGEIDGRPVMAALRGLAGEVANGTGGVDGLFALGEGAGELSQGRFIRLHMALPEQEGLVAVPHEAVYGTDRVYTIDADSRMRPLKVERVGEWRDAQGHTLVLIRAGSLASGTPLVTTQLPNALDGLLVKPAGGD